MASGGKRIGAGRKKSEPTKLTRVAVAAASATRVITDYYLGKARRIWQEHYGEGFMVSLAGFEKRRTRSLMGGGGEIEVIVCHAEKDGLRGVFSIDLDTGSDGFVFEGEEDI